MKRIILSSILIVLTAGTFVFGATKAFFADTETSTANVFTAGAIDLTIDNESFYNGVLNASTTWTQTDLTIEKFFDFPDLKPDDYGEDTISLHVDTNDAYLCANVTLTSNNENGQTEPESLVDLTVGANEGELAQLVNFLWWADDGDNVLETGESVISQGNFNQLGIGTTYPLTLADSATNIWTGVAGPIPGNSTRYIGKAWCFGTLGTAPITQDNSGTLMSPAGNNDGVNGAGQPEDGGVTCSGNALGNESQTDSLTADVSFEAVQARHNGGFRCALPEPIVSTVTVVKVVVGGPEAGNPAAFSFVLDAQSPTAFEGDGTNVVPVTAGAHSVVEVPVQDYVTTYSSVNGANCTNLVVPGNGNVTCTITNTFTPIIVPNIPTTLTIQKIVSGGTAVATDFSFTIDSNPAVLGSNEVTPGAHVVSEVAALNYTPAYSGGCDSNGNITAISNTNATCTITNTFVPPTPTTITITKNVVGGTATTGSFTYRIDGNIVPLGSNVVTPGSHTITETGGPANYVATFGSGCNASGTIVAVSNTNVTCAITNTFVPLTDNFGTSGACVQDIPGWDEDPGDTCVNGTVSKNPSVSGDDSVSPDGGNFALIGNLGHICRGVNATGLQNLQLKYYWRGDTDAEVTDNGLVQYYTSGTCLAPVGLVSVATHDLDNPDNNLTEPWSTLQSINLPGSLNNTTFFIRIAANTNGGNESLRFDGVTLTGIPI
jgi:hypothetical protein